MPNAENSEEFFWDEILSDLLLLFSDPWLRPVSHTTKRQNVATLFALRAVRRVIVVDPVFKQGYYWETHPLIRSAYEDWLQLAYVLREPGSDRCVEFGVDTRKHDARLYDSFLALAGEDATERLFGDPPPEVAPFIGLTRSQTKSMRFSDLATDVGLLAVHDFVYAYLSNRSHPEVRSDDLFDHTAAMSRARIPRRDAREEIRLALWFSWFTARVAIIALREFSIDREDFCDTYFLPLAEAGSDIETCVFVRESN
jgi:Family of unknown function (DUF5677)